MIASMQSTKSTVAACVLFWNLRRILFTLNVVYLAWGEMDKLLLAAPDSGESAAGHPELTEAQVLLKQMVLDSVTSPNTRRSYSLTLNELFAFSAGRPLSRALLQAWKASMDSLAPSTINVKLSAVRRLVGEARRNGLISAEDAANLSDIPNVRQRGNRLGNWLTREQAKELLQVPDRSTLKGKRDYAILALLVGCALRRRELASLEMSDLQEREGRWVIANLCGKGNRIRTVAVPLCRFSFTHRKTRPYSEARFTLATVWET
jgi:site-specific recombinase XerD